MSEELKKVPQLVFFQMDPQFIRGMMIAMLGAMSGMKFAEMSSFIKNARSGMMKSLAEKADVQGDLGGAKMAFVIQTLLSELFEGVLKLERSHSKILIEMVAGMMVNGSYQMSKDLQEGPKRG